MQIDTKISVIKTLVIEEADRGENSPAPQKAGKPQGQPVVPNALDIAELGEIDVVTISKGLRPVGESVAGPEPATLSFQAGREAAPLPPPPDGDLKAFKGAGSKDQTLKGNNRPDGLVINNTAVEDVDVVRISRELKSAIKSVIINDAGAARRVDIAQEAGVNGFLLPFLGTALPGWKVRLKQVYRKKSGKLFRKKKKTDDSDKGQEPPEEQASPDSTADCRPRYYDEPGALKLAGYGFINTGDSLRHGFRLEFDIKAENALALRGDRLILPTIEIDYSGPSDALEDYRFSFEAEHGDGGGSFKGQGYGLLIIDLAEVGKAEDGSTIYGVSAEQSAERINDWAEIALDGMLCRLKSLPGDRG